MNMLQRIDPDRNFLSLFIRDMDKREMMFALNLLNDEIARLKDIVDTPHMGLIRLQWWRDEISKIFSGTSGVPAHPVLADLSRLIPKYRGALQEDMFLALLNAREADFEDYEDFDIRSYARAIHAPLLKLYAAVLGEERDVTPLAEAYCLVGLLRSIPFYRARLTTLPLGRIDTQLVRTLCDAAHQLLQQDSTRHRYFRAYHTLAGLYLNQLKGVGYQPEKIGPLPFKELRVWWGSF